MISGVEIILQRSAGYHASRTADYRIYGKEFYLAHGDGLGDPDKKFKLLRQMFHSKTLQTMFSAIHPRWSVELGLSWAKHSRQKRADGKEPDYMGENKEHLVLYTKDYLKSHPNILIFSYRASAH